MKYEKGSFVTVPNKKHLKGKPSEMQSIYFWICDHADENGVCFPSRKTLANESGSNIRTVDKYLTQLVEEGFLAKFFRKKEGTNEQTSNLYQIMVIEEDPVSKTALPSVKNSTTPSVKNSTLTKPIINRTHLNKKATAFSPYGKKGSMEAIILAQEQKRMMADEEKGKRAHAIIGAFISYKMDTLKNNIRTKGQLYEFWQRHIKTANKLKVWDDDQLERAFEKADKEYQKIEWSLEALLKYLTK